jgi:integrase
MSRVRDLDQAVDLYIGELARRGRSKATRESYQWILWKFTARYDADYAPWEITADHCRAFLDRWVDASPSTLAQYVSILRGFFGFLLDEDIIERNPMDRIHRPPRKRPEDLDVVTAGHADVERLYEAIEEWDELLCVAVLTYLGPRRSAAARARRQDVDLERGTIRFREKGGKVIVKPLPEEFAAILRDADSQGVWTKPSDYLIPNRREPRRAGERSSKVVYANVKRVAARARVDVHPHALRAAFAVQFDEQHPDQLIALQELMGHSRIETTRVYLRRKDKAAAMEQVRDLSWGASRFEPSSAMPPAGFEPASEALTVPEPLRRKLDELRARSSAKERA